MVLIQILGKFSFSDVLGKMADTASRLFAGASPRRLE